jgi:hypothetical protein
MRMNRWAKKGVVDRVFEQLQVEQIVRIRIEAFSIDSTSVKVHPHGTGALKKDRRPSAIPRRMEYHDSHGYRGCSNGPVFTLSPGHDHDAPHGRPCWKNSDPYLMAFAAPGSRSHCASHEAKLSLTKPA